ncbi:cytochrome P450 [Trametes meyenii]|nr:cytochrome P450 [Trametes meyenii]
MLAIVLIASYAVWSYVLSVVSWRRRSRGRPLPPGPKPLPLIGNALAMPRAKPWYRFRDLCATYGEVVYLNALGTPVLIIGSSRSAQALLEKRSANTSDRPPSALFHLIGHEGALSSMHYGQEWRDHKRAFWRVFHPGAIGDYRDIEREMVRKLLKKLLASPHDFKEHTRYSVSATAMKVLYGLDAQEAHDPLIAQADLVFAFVGESATGNHPLDYFPFLQHVPAWIPGAGFHYALAECKKSVIRMKETLYEDMKTVMSQSQVAPHGLGKLLSTIDRGGPKDVAQQEELIKNIGLVAFEAGSDTSYSMLLGFYFAMSQYPEVQKKAQAELDTVVGRDRLPDHSDREALVYVNAVIKESLRWHVVVPLCLPHRTIEDNIFEGYFIPAGTMLIPNTWAMLHDPEAYECPDEFIPERFIRDGRLDFAIPDPANFAFGYGRRICPGRHFADELLFLHIASILHVFNIEAPVDKHGQPVKVERGQTHGLTSYPEPEDYQCLFKPRFEEAISLIHGD